MHEQRIERMRAEGLLTPGQADALQASLAPLARGAERPRRRVLPVVPVVAAIGVIALLTAAALALYPAADPASMEIQNVAETLNTSGGTGAMNRPFSLLVSAVLLLLPLVLIVGAFGWFYNRIVDREERVYEA